MGLCTWIISNCSDGCSVADCRSLDESAKSADRSASAGDSHNRSLIKMEDINESDSSVEYVGTFTATNLDTSDSSVEIIR